MTINGISQDTVEQAASPSAAQVKRFLEIWSSGLYSREELIENPEPILEAHRCEIDPVLIGVLSESKFLRGHSGRNELLPHHFDDFREFIALKVRWREDVRTGAASSDPVFRAFRERQIKRCELELGVQQNTMIVHIPLAIEMCSGCSVRCWFCALDAPPLKAVYEYTPENLTFLREVLQVCKEVIGGGTRWASSYWGTDPMDNPHQEQWNDEFHQAFGMYPQTTTAVPLRDPARIRKLLLDSNRKGCLVNRFSVRTGSQLRGIHAEFSAEELLWTELVLQNKEADTVKARAGRLLHFDEAFPKLAQNDEAKLLAMLEERDPESAKKATSVFINLPGSTAPIVREREHEADAEEFNVAINVPGTTSCVTGFKLNMVERTVELISPCPANERWNLGHIVFEAGTFDTAEELRTLMRGMIERNMAEGLTAETPIRFVPRLKYLEEPDGFSLGSVFARSSCRDEAHGAYLRRLGQLAHEGRYRAGEIALQLFYEFGVSEVYTMNSIRNLFTSGLIAEEPLEVHA